MTTNADLELQAKHLLDPTPEERRVLQIRERAVSVLMGEFYELNMRVMKQKGVPIEAKSWITPNFPADVGRYLDSLRSLELRNMTHSITMDGSSKKDCSLSINALDHNKRVFSQITVYNSKNQEPTVHVDLKFMSALEILTNGVADAETTLQHGLNSGSIDQNILAHVKMGQQILIFAIEQTRDFLAKPVAPNQKT